LRAAFTLVEVMVVVAIMAIVLTLSIPFLRNAIDSPKGMSGAFKILDEACREARAIAILQQTTSELRIRGDGTLEVSGVGGGGGAPVSVAEAAASEGRGAAPSAGGPAGGPRKLPEGVGIEAILANGEDVTELDMARVQFRANGTCDELQMVLTYPANNERRQVWLDVVTSVLDFESDPSKFKMR
jgi:prepilin-type N-terminal cleavage/methylation domain-containing protein